MIKHNNISDINDKTDEGKLLVMALAALTSVSKEQIESGKWGGMTHPDIALQQIVDMTNDIYFTEEYKKYKQSILRDNKINNILRDNNA